MPLPTPGERDALFGHAQREGWWFRAKEEMEMTYVRPRLGPEVSILVAGQGHTTLT